MEKLKAHLFVCTNAKDENGRCGNKNSENLRREVKNACAKEPWAKDIRINAAGCLGRCEQGITAVLYPQGTWFFELKESDSAVLIKAVKDGLGINK